MTRLRKGPTVAELEREYVYAEPPISITDLAAKYGLARSGVADKATVGKWFQKRQAFRAKVQDAVTDAMAEKWAEMQAQVYERLMRMGMTYLDNYEQDVTEGKIKTSTRDMISVAAMMKSLLDDLTKRPVNDSTVLMTDEFEGTDAEARDVIEYVKRLTAGGGGGELPGRAEPDAAEGAANPRPD